jgi:hypothetical protein
MKSGIEVIVPVLFGDCYTVLAWFFPPGAAVLRANSRFLDFARNDKQK